MMMRKHAGIAVVLMLATVVFAACGSDELPPPPRAALPPPRNVAASTTTVKMEPPPFAYHGDARRDPFIALNAEGSAATANSEDVVVPTLSALSLKGIIDDGKSMAAIINGGGITYILRDRRLYDNRQRLVRGITGIIRRDSVVMIGQDRSTKELKLHEK